MAVAKQECPPVNQFDRLPEEIWTHRIFPLVPHVSRLRCRCVCSKWERVLKALEQAAKPAPVWCLAIGVHVLGVSEHGEDIDSPLHCIAIAPSGGVVPLPLSFPPDWAPKDNGGLRAGGGLVAYLCQGQYMVGNPFHNMWEKVEAEVRSLPFVRTRFELVVDECDGSYDIVAYGMNELSMKSRDQLGYERDHDNWVIQVYSSKTRTWRTGAAVHQTVFRELCDVCVFERTVYFVGWIGGVRFPSLGMQPWLQDHAVQERRLQEFKKFYSLVIWAYDLDSDNVREVVPSAQFFAGKELKFPSDYEPYDSSIRLHVSRQPCQEASSSSSLQFSLIVAARLMGPTRMGGPFEETLCRLLLNEQNPSLRCWVTQGMVRLDELILGGPRAALVADTWGVSVVAYGGFSYSNRLHPRAMMRILCYQRDEQKWAEWHGYGPQGMHMEKVPAVGFVACECCGG